MSFLFSLLSSIRFRIPNQFRLFVGRGDLVVLYDGRLRTKAGRDIGTPVLYWGGVISQTGIVGGWIGRGSGWGGVGEVGVYSGERA